MPDFNIILPSKPSIVNENEISGVYEIDGLYPGYGHTLGNSLRRIILSSLPGFAITSLKIEGVNHQFSTIAGVKEDVINIILNLKRIRFRVVGDEPQTIKLHAKGVGEISAGALRLPGQVTVLNPDQVIATITDKNTTLDAEIVIEKGLGYISSEMIKKDKSDVGNIALDAAFTPIKKVSYEIENTRVGNRTDFNKLIIHIETDGTVSPREALEQSILTMVNQLKAIIGFKEEEIETSPDEIQETDVVEMNSPKDELSLLKIKTEDLGLSGRTQKALLNAGLKTIGGISRKKELDLKEIDGLGEKGLQEIKKTLAEYDLTLKSK
ncbi:MAG: DNA-directed RNA polymerase subunit alpha [Candidatus Vogelbacteria bacterium CG10_big_fil_rev_8_21_14_0_10_49_38]|uniref:DNA-directed RNA polymerase subunit alpha n=1 Tax=Candidatus Vogelbacteria bacterium CG10_big_fil_rev_8_21_14_0_10_49_38 TaxID=1975043 RepID=A0A2H0RJB0_9BACT|nr:MAG: DNA-directed RNA polymerase subunit alpha [bacterium CG10_49_38]PIR45865.1 MAG: DNA-directed RNA polymerase subunit alpha [Candidatus Vogelbacteria bacterium CG10_big_fil_rev_8_21_14_0_10_49_38]